jgi:hypothetical protein
MPLGAQLVETTGAEGALFAAARWLADAIAA